MGKNHEYGAGSVSPLPNGKWRWTGYYVDNTGKVHRPTKTFATQKEALDFKTEQLKQVEINRIKKTADMTVEELFNLWLEDSKDDIAASTRRNSTHNIRKHILPVIGDNPIGNINDNKLQQHFNALKKSGKSEKTIFNIYTDFRKLLKFAEEEKYLPAIPKLENLKKPKYKPSKTPVNLLEQEEVRKILYNEKSKKSYYYNTIVFLAATGLRVSEMAFTEKDIFKKPTSKGEIFCVHIHNTVHRVLDDDNIHSKISVENKVKSTNSERVIYLSENAEKALLWQLAYRKNHYIHSPYIFCTSNGKPLDSRNVAKAFHRMCGYAGVPKKGLHSLRKDYINSLLLDGVNPMDLVKTSGHSVQTMFKYYHNLFPEGGMKLAEKHDKVYGIVYGDKPIPGEATYLNPPRLVIEPATSTAPTSSQTKPKKSGNHILRNSIKNEEEIVIINEEIEEDEISETLEEDYDFYDDEDIEEEEYEDYDFEEEDEGDNESGEEEGYAISARAISPDEVEIEEGVFIITVKNPEHKPASEVLKEYLEEQERMRQERLARRAEREKNSKE